MDLGASKIKKMNHWFEK